jgi:D-3-phosphoglycerate dehydrogenase
VDKCTGKGVVVFNTPGANANAVKELAVLALLLSSRKIYDGISYARSLVGKGAEVPKIIEKNKSQFVGPEVQGKKLGVIGLGAIGVMVANAAVALNMVVEGHDPFISVESAWHLARAVKNAKGIDRLIATSDYITLHMPVTDKTRGFINEEKISHMKDGVRIINLARGGVVDEGALIKALESGKVGCYVTDFVSEALLKTKNVICFPHLGASTPEAEDNCATMAVSQVMDFLENGNITNSVNFPACALQRQGDTRLTIVNKNIQGMVGKFSTLLAESKLNIRELLNKSKDNIAYNLVDIDGKVSEGVIKKLLAIEGVVKVREINGR